MDTAKGRRGWWWLDANREWRFARLRFTAWLRARRARRRELEIRLDVWR